MFSEETRVLSDLSTSELIRLLEKQLSSEKHDADYAVRIINVLKYREKPQTKPVLEKLSRDDSVSVVVRLAAQRAVKFAPYPPTVSEFASRLEEELSAKNLSRAWGITDALLRIHDITSREELRERAIKFLEKLNSPEQTFRAGGQSARKQLEALISYLGECAGENRKGWLDVFKTRLRQAGVGKETITELASVMNRRRILSPVELSKFLEKEEIALSVGRASTVPYGSDKNLKSVKAVCTSLQPTSGKARTP